MGQRENRGCPPAPRQTDRVPPPDFAKPCLCLGTPRPGQQEGAPPGPVLSAPSTRGSSCQQIWLWGSHAPGSAGPSWGAALGMPGSERATPPHLPPPSEVHGGCQAAWGEGGRLDGNPDRATPPGTPLAKGPRVLRAVGMAPAGRTVTCYGRAQPAGAAAGGSRRVLGPLCLLPALPRPPLPYLMLLRPQRAMATTGASSGQGRTGPLAGHPKAPPEAACQTCLPEPPSQR